MSQFSENKNSETHEQSISPIAPDSVLANVFCLRSNLKFETRIDNEQAYVVIEDSVRGKFFRVGAQEYRVLARIDGNLDGHQIAQSLLSDPENKLDDEEAQRLTQDVFKWCLKSNLATSDRLDNGKRLSQQSAAIGNAKTLGWLNPISFKIRLFNPNQTLKRVAPWFNWLFSFWFLCVWIITAIFATTILFGRWEQLASASQGILSNDGWIWLLLTWVVLKVVHEVAHGVACRRYGGDVPEAGMLLLLFTPMAYVNVTSMWRFQNRWQRMVVAAAGMYVELFVSFLAIIVWSKSSGIIADVAFNVFIMASVTTILFNANPLMRFDGYFLLSDALSIPNLYTKGTNWFRGSMQSIIFGVPHAPEAIPASERFAAKTYGCLAFFWKISISVSLILGAAVLFQGAGLVMSAAAAFLWFAVPMYKQLRVWFSANSQQSISPRRTLLSGTVIVLVLLACFVVFQAPATKSAPAIIQFADQLVVRAQVDGFISEIFVDDGDSVDAGELLIRLDNPKLDHEVLVLQQRLAESEIQIRIHRNERDQSMVQSETENRNQLQKQLEEKRTQREGLMIHAPVDGFVFYRGLSNRIGSFATQGDVLLNFATDSSKEVLVSFDQRDFDSVSWQTGRQLRVWFPNRSITTAKLMTVNPSASVVPTEPSMCATAGGPLPVKPSTRSDESSFEFLRPRFDATLELPVDESRALFSGQRGRVFFSTTEQSIGTYFYLAAHDWLSTKLDVVFQSH
ncbi:MAG: biotin/lipoyl-binding protein [Planctomycetota bacterium]